MRSLIYIIAFGLAGIACAHDLGGPKGAAGFHLSPFSRLSLEFGSDNLAFAPSDWDRLARASDGEQVDYLSPLLRRSFDLEGLDPSQTSRLLAQELGSGARIWASAHSTWLSAAWKGTEIAIGSDLAEDLHLPGALFLLVFSPDRGLQSGHALDLSDFRQDFRWTSHVSASREFALPVPSILERWGHFDRASLTIGAGYFMGHALFLADMDRGQVELDGDGTALSMDGRMRIRSAGLGLQGNMAGMDVKPFQEAAAGHGLGLTLGATFAAEKHFMEVRIENVGAIVWGQTQAGTFHVQGDSLTLSDMVRGLRPAGADSGRPNPFSNQSDSVHAGGPLVTALPAAVSAYYARTLSLRGRSPSRWTLEQIIVEGRWKQALAPGPGVSFIPTVETGVVQPWLHGKLPFRIGWSVGGPERFASALGLGLRLSRFSCAAELKSFGTLYGVPRRGFRMGWSMQAGM